MKKNFLSGFLSGLLGAVLIFLTVIIILTFTNDKQTEAVKKPEVTTEETKNEDKTQSYDKIVGKLTYLETLVDTYYLEKVDPTVYADGIYNCMNS
jgi:carboxyl-terminal processing protease